MARLWLMSALISLALAQCPSLLSVQTSLSTQLSSGSSVVGAAQRPQRWSAYGEPLPSFVVNVACEEDVAIAVNYCNQNNLTFLAQNGGNGWANTFDLGSCGVIINLAALNSIDFFKNNTRARIGGGVLVSDMIQAGYDNNVMFANPTCPCLGFLGTSLGGGLTRMSGEYGWSVDQIESLTAVLASGATVHVTNGTNPDLFWALRGAAANFGIVTSAVVKAHPKSSQAENIVWQGPLVFAEDKLEDLVTAMDELTLAPNMQIDLLLGTTGAPNYTAKITAIPFFLGNATAAEQAFAPILDLGPTSNNAVEMPYSESSDWALNFCTKGARKPTYGVSGVKLDPVSFRAVFEEMKCFIETYGGDVVGLTSILVEHYPTQKGLEIGYTASGSSYPWRHLPTHVAAIPWYGSPNMDAAANAWGEKVRGLLRTEDGISMNSTYINFAHGDETLYDIYGESLPRLQMLKAQYDPGNRFGQWFPLA